ncbi:MAG: hypothetical protein WB539_10620 [Planktothrix agardhii]|uniref:hypothetical protein n=1 Tax=Planktothrix agardhii TaxID=1160 RepID=UPI003C3ADEB1
MADNVRIPAIIAEAKKQGFFNNFADSILFVDSLRRSKKILRILEKEGELNTEQLAIRMDFDLNTIRIYLRGLQKSNLIEGESQGLRQLKIWRLKQ